SVNTGANGYYYFLEPTGTVKSSGSSVLAYTTAANNAPGAQDGATLATGATGSQTDLNVYGNWLVEQADVSIGTLSALDAAYGTAAGRTPAAGFSLPNRAILTAAPAFNLDQPLNLPGGT